MATETRFNLNAAIENWRNELTAQPELSSDNRRELEKHLVDAMAELRQRGLSDDESFWLAQRRVGRPQQLAEEFEKADPAKVWRERIFWMVLAILVAFTLGTISSSISDLLCSWFPPIQNHVGDPFLSNAIWLLGVFGILIFLMNRKLDKPFVPFNWVIEDRFRFVVVTMGIILAVNIVCAGMMFEGYNKFRGVYSPMGPFVFIGRILIYSIIRDLGLIVALIWSVRGKRSKISKLA